MFAVFPAVKYSFDGSCEQNIHCRLVGAKQVRFAGDGDAERLVVPLREVRDGEMQEGKQPSERGTETFQALHGALV